MPTAADGFLKLEEERDEDGRHSSGLIAAAVIRGCWIAASFPPNLSDRFNDVRRLAQLNYTSVQREASSMADVIELPAEGRWILSNWEETELRVA